MDRDAITSAVRGQLDGVRDLAGRLTPLDRARFTRELVRAVYDAVKFDPLLGGMLVGGADRELEGLAAIGDAAESWCVFLTQEQIEGLRGTD